MATIRFDVREIHSATFEAQVSDDEAREFEHLTDNEKKERADELMSRGCADFVDDSQEYSETIDGSACEFEVNFSESANAQMFNPGDRVLVHDSIEKARGTVATVGDTIGVNLDTGPSHEGKPFHFRAEELTPLKD